jgi:hypothetical protein
MPASQKPNLTMELTVQATGWPKPGKRMGWLKSSEGQFFSIRPAMVNNFAKGEVCHVTYIEGDLREDGTRWNPMILSKQAGAPSGSQQKVIPQIRAATNPTDSEQMFVVALLKETTTPTDTLQMLQARGDTYKKLFQYLFGNPEKRKNDQRMNDEIPDGPPDYAEEGNWEPEQ